ncbi:MAG: hypothetical protein QF713_01640 [Dehalococcoidales bacterium]|nr:hypothetical protein [Dehalococcoidales bacterium]
MAILLHNRKTRYIMFCLVFLLLFVLFSGCQAQINYTDGNGNNDAREALEVTFPGKEDTDGDGFSDPLDAEPLNSFILGDSVGGDALNLGEHSTIKPEDVILKNEALENSLKDWLKTDPTSLFLFLKL